MVGVANILNNYMDIEITPESEGVSEFSARNQAQLAATRLIPDPLPRTERSMDIVIAVIPERDQRPEVNGADWFFDQFGTLQVRVSPLSDWRYEALLGIHEAVEAIMCKHNGVTQQQVDAFDLEYDKTHTFDTNAGDDPKAPYKREHCLATAIERILCAELGVDWETYDKELAQSYPGPSKKSA